MSSPVSNFMSAPVSVIYQDDYILAVDKRAGTLIHSDGTARTSGVAAETLTDQVRAYLEGNGCLQQARNLQALHRLDRDTTGIVLFSLNKETQSLFDALISNRDLHKYYLAIVRGEFPEKERDIALPLGKDRHDARKMRVSKTGKPALTHVRRLEVRCEDSGKRSLMLIELGTGRKHQIRVHFSALGFPIVGDCLYGDAASREPLMLHAYELAFIHPVTGENHTLRTEWPARFSDWSVQNL